jgi:hypothetical protein
MESHYVANHELEVFLSSMPDLRHLKRQDTDTLAAGGKLDTSSLDLIDTCFRLRQLIDQANKRFVENECLRYAQFFDQI